MKFGKLPTLDGVDFTLPPDPAGPLPAAAMAAETYLGCSVWNNRAWVGRLYPPGTRPADFLLHYVRRFNAIELNVTHYQIPAAETVRRWRQVAGQSSVTFRYCPKWPRAISHDKQLINADHETDAFCAAVAGLGAHLGMTFLQLPPHLGPDRRSQVAAFLDRWDGRVPLAVEFRHPDWFGSDASGFDLLRERGVAAVITDVAGRRDVLHLQRTAPSVFVRFVGNGLHPTDFPRLDAWVQRLVRWRAQGAGDVWFFVHSPDNDSDPQLAAYLAPALRGHLRARLPSANRIEQPRQGTLFG